MYDRLDGLFASVESDIRILAGAKTVEHASGLYRSNTAADSAVDSLRRIAGGLRISAHILAVANNKQDTIIRRGVREGDAVIALWTGATLIPDEITKADTGEVKLTAVQLGAFKTLRTAGFSRVETQHA